MLIDTWVNPRMAIPFYNNLGIQSWQCCEMHRNVSRLTLISFDISCLSLALIKMYPLDHSREFKRKLSV